MGNRLDSRFVEPQVPDPTNKAGQIIVSDGVNYIVRSKSELGLVDTSIYEKFMTQPIAVNTVSFAANKNNYYYVKGTVNITLPIGPVFNDTVTLHVLDPASSVITLLGGENLINGNSYNKTLLNTITKVDIKYCGAGYGWYIF